MLAEGVEVPVARAVLVLLLLLSQDGVLFTAGFDPGPCRVTELRGSVAAVVEENEDDRLFSVVSRG